MEPLSIATIALGSAAMSYISFLILTRTIRNLEVGYELADEEIRRIALVIHEKKIKIQDMDRDEAIRVVESIREAAGP